MSMICKKTEEIKQRLVEVWTSSIQHLCEKSLFPVFLICKIVQKRSLGETGK